MSEYPSEFLLHQYQSRLNRVNWGQCRRDRTLASHRCWSHL
jgi:hypothetical protein